MARKILLADDSVTAQNMGRKILADAGYEVITVNNGSAALKKIAEQKPDLIVLDVYMPGYSGLEVCQRLKDAQETSRVPVLLTVGKLEPFKPEEARRARADGFIVKPFEASELLSALSKLEDKIVPRAESKPGRFARANAALDEGRYDKTVAIEEDSSWKNRIAFPKKKTEPAPEETDDSEIYNPVNKDLRTVVERRAEKPYETKTEETLVDLGALAPEGLPKDVTPEEIAALAAAAAQVKGKIAEARIEEVKTAEVAVEGKTAASEVSIPQENVAATLAAQKPEEKIEEKAEETLAAKIEAAGGKPAEAEPEVASIAAPSIAAPSHADLMAAIASLETDAVATAETNSGNQGSAYPNSGAGSWSHNGTEADEPVTMAVATGAGESSAAASRWSAVAVALAPEEAAVSLEQEMQKAQAAFAAADAGQAGAVATILSPSVETQVQASHAETLESPSALASSVSESTSALASALAPAVETSSPAEVAVAPAAPTETPALQLPATHVQEVAETLSAAASVPADAASHLPSDVATDAISAAVQELEAVAAAYAEQMKPAPVAPQPFPVKDFVIAGPLAPEAPQTSAVSIATETSTDISRGAEVNTEKSPVVNAAPALDIPPVESPKPEALQPAAEEPSRWKEEVSRQGIEESRIAEAKVEAKTETTPETKIEEPKIEESKIDESKIAESKIETSKIDESKIDAVRIDEVKTEAVKSEGTKSDVATPSVGAAAALEPASIAAAAASEKTAAPVGDVPAEGSSASSVSASLPSSPSSYPSSSSDPSTSSETGSAKFFASSIFSSGIVSSAIDMAAVAFNDLAAGGISDMAKKESEIAANTAAAWANWRRIRETDPKAVAPSAEPQKDEPVAAAPQDAAMAVAAGAEQAFEEGRAAIDSEPDDIASIVDSVLADLRPKIVEEISRKMGKKK